jgi:hypothetical protein
MPTQLSQKVTTTDTLNQPRRYNSQTTAQGYTTRGAAQPALTRAGKSATNPMPSKLVIDVDHGTGATKGGRNKTPSVTKTRSPAIVVGTVLKSAQSFAADAITLPNTSIWTQRGGVLVRVAFSGAFIFSALTRSVGVLLCGCCVGSYKRGACFLAYPECWCF